MPLLFGCYIKYQSIKISLLLEVLFLNDAQVPDHGYHVINGDLNVTTFLKNMSDLCSLLKDFNPSCYRIKYVLLWEKCTSTIALKWNPMFKCLDKSVVILIYYG